MQILKTQSEYMYVQIVAPDEQLQLLVGVLVPAIRAEEVDAW